MGVYIYKKQATFSGHKGLEVAVSVLYIYITFIIQPISSGRIGNVF